MSPRLVLGLALLLAACGTRELDTIERNPGCPLPPLELAPDPPARLIDDMEDGDLTAIAGAGIDGGWEFWDDDTNPAFAPGVSGRCAALGRFAVNAQSDGQTGWGASASLFFRGFPRPQAFDGRPFNAISMYLATGATKPDEVLTKVGVSTMDTAWNGRCKSCVDNYATRVMVGPRWKRFVFRFSDLHQDGWGDIQQAMRKDEIVQLHVAFEEKFDLWIDHVAFEALPEPGGPAGDGGS